MASSEYSTRAARRERASSALMRHSPSALTSSATSTSMINISSASNPVGRVLADGRNIKTLAKAATALASSPGPSPPYQALIITAAENKKTTLSSISDPSSRVSTKASVLASRAAPYRSRWGGKALTSSHPHLRGVLSVWHPSCDYLLAR